MNRYTWGVILIGLGTLALLQSLGFAYFGLTFWPVAITLFGGYILWSSFRRTSWFGLALGLWLGAIGLMDILRKAGVTTLSGGDVAMKGWPLLIIAWGIATLLGSRGKRHAEPRVTISFDDDDAPLGVGDVHYGAAPWRLEQDLNLSRSVGDVNLDLSVAEVTPGGHRIVVQGGVGDTFIRVPDDISLNIVAECGIGEVEVLGDRRGGIGPSLRRRVVVPESDLEVTLEVKVGIGEVRVIQVPGRRRCEV